MKKFLITVASIVTASVGLLSFLQPTEYALALKNLSEVRYNLFEGKNESMVATLMTGEREDPYSLNGIAEGMVDFGIVTVKFLVDTNNLMGTPTYKLTVDDDYYEGELQENPFENNFVVDIGEQVSTNSQVYLLVEWDTLYETLKLEPISTGWEVDYKKALEIAVEDIAEQNLKTLIKEGKLNAEVQIQIIGDPQGILDEYYWYVNFYGRDGSVINLVINPLTGEIISKRVLVY